MQNLDTNVLKAVYAGSALFLAALFAIAFYLGYDLYVFAAVAGAPLIVLMFQKPKIWTYSLFFLSGAFLSGDSEGITAFDVAAGVFYVFGLMIWMFWALIVSKRKILKNSADWLIIFFFIMCVFMSVISFANDLDFLTWARELSVYLIILIYFPVREYFTKKKDFVRLLAVFSVSIFALSFYEVYDYYVNGLSKVVYAFQMSDRSTNNAILTLAPFSGVVFLLDRRKPYLTIYLIAYTVVTFIGLLSTFSRTFWIMFFFCLFVLFLYTTIRKKILLTLYFLIVVGLFSLLGYLLMKDNFMLLLGMAENRITSAKRGTGDISMKARYAEWDSVIEKIMEHPLGGNGLGKTFRFYNVIFTTTIETQVIHNGYLSMAYRLGIPLALCFFFVHFYYMIKAEKYARKLKDGFYKSIAFIALSGLLIMLVSNLLGPLYYTRNGMMVMAFSFAIIGFIDLKIRKEANVEKSI